MLQKLGPVVANCSLPCLIRNIGSSGGSRSCNSATRVFAPVPLNPYPRLGSWRHGLRWPLSSDGLADCAAFVLGSFPVAGAQ